AFFSLKNTLVSSSSENEIRQMKRFVGMCNPNPATYGYRSAEMDIGKYVDSYVVGEIILDGELHYCMRNMNDMMGDQGFLVSAKEFDSQETKIKEASLLTYYQLNVGKKVNITMRTSTRYGENYNKIFSGTVGLIHRYDDTVSVIVATPRDNDKSNANSLVFYVFELKDAPDSVLSAEYYDWEGGGWVPVTVKGTTKYSISFQDGDFQVGETVCYKNDSNEVTSDLITDVTVGGFMLANRIFVPLEKIAKMNECAKLP
ncbi:hypothetical protein K2X05_05355, partial [bacterium]|nr:hypothetical protein [bacterium]